MRSQKGRGFLNITKKIKEAKKYAKENVCSVGEAEKAIFAREWRKILIDKGLSETQFAKNNDLSQHALNRSINTGAIKFIRMVQLLDVLGYDVKIKSREV